MTARTGRPLGSLRAAWRYLLASLFFWGLLAVVWKLSAWWLVLWPVPFAWILFNPRRQALYDVLAGTMLVRSAEASGVRSSSGPAVQ